MKVEVEERLLILPPVSVVLNFVTDMGIIRVRTAQVTEDDSEIKDEKVSLSLVE